MILATLLAIAAAPGAPAAATPVTVADNYAASLRQIGFSDAAARMLRDAAFERDPDVQKFAPRVIDLVNRTKAILAAQQFDEAAFLKAWRERDAVDAELRALQGEKRKALFARLPSADRPLFARVIAGALRPPPAPAVAPPPPAPPAAPKP